MTETITLTQIIEQLTKSAETQASTMRMLYEAVELLKQRVEALEERFLL